jgi:hypothetical protein
VDPHLDLQITSNCFNNYFARRIAMKNRRATVTAKVLDEIPIERKEKDGRTLKKYDRPYMLNFHLVEETANQSKETLNKPDHDFSSTGANLLRPWVIFGFDAKTRSIISFRLILEPMERSQRNG